MYRQAESYRLANYWAEASLLYKECFEKDAYKYVDALYWDAVCQRSLGNYAVAEESVNRFLQSYSAGNNYHQAAEKELKTLQFIKAQITRPDTALYYIQKNKRRFRRERNICSCGNFLQPIPCYEHTN